MSHTFIQREVAGLREQGVTIDTFAIRRGDADEVLSRADEAEARATYALLPVRLSHLLRAHLRALVRHPEATRRRSREALRLAPAGARGALWQGFYFAEAVLLWDRCRRARGAHMHAHFANVASDVALLAARLGREAGDGAALVEPHHARLDRVLRRARLPAGREGAGARRSSSASATSPAAS